MNARVNYLLVEDDAGDGQNVEGHLLRHNPLARCQRVTSLAEFEAAIQQEGWDVVLSGGNVPQLDIRTTLEILQARCPDPPLILVAGRIGEEQVAELLKLGVADFVLKDNLARLLPAIERSRWEAAVRRARREADATLVQSEDKYRNLFECNRDATLTSDLTSGRFTSANPAALQMFGVRTELEFQSLSAADLSPERQPDGRASAETGRAMVAITVREGSHFFEWTHRRVDGRQFLSDVLLTRIELDGKPIILGTIRDISERKAAEQALRDSRTTLEAALASMTDAVFISDVAGQFIDFNDAFATFHKFKNKAETLRKLASYAEILEVFTASGELVPLEMWAVPRALRGETVANAEYAFRRKDTGETWAGSANFSPIRDKENKIVGAVVAVRDITEQQKKTEELRWKTAFLEALVHSAADGLAVVDKQMKKIFQNQKMLDLWKIPPEVACQPDNEREYAFMANQTKNPAEYEARIRHILAHPDESAQDEIALKDGTVLNRHTSLVRDHDGKRYGRVWTFHDITKRRQMEMEFRQAQKMEAIGTLAGGIAHDFNNMLCSIFGYGHLLQQEMAGNPPAQEYLGEILKAANRAKDLVQQILAFSRQREQKRELIRLETVIKEAMKFLRASLPANIKIDIQLDETPAVLADPTQIYQVTMNLAANALHAMEGRPGRLVVMLTAFAPDASFIRLHPELQPIRYTRLTITDTGQGMDAKTLERIFEPFFTTKPVGKGTGLGLSVVHGIVQSHGGVITVASSPGRGTTFDLYLPAQAAEATVIETTISNIPRGHGEHILFLDDEPALTKALQRLLEGLDYRVTLSNSASEAIRWFGENPARFALVITDLTMPEMDGIDVARKIHALRADVPVILVSGRAPDLSREKLLGMGISGLLEKPFSLSALADMVNELV